MIVELARDIFTEGGVIALIVVFLLLILGVMAYTLLSLVRQQDDDGETVKTQAIVIAQLVEPMQTIAAQLRTVSEANAATSANLLRVVEMLAEHDQRVVEIGAMVNSAVSSMRETVDARSEQLEGLPGRVREAMANDFEQLPKAIENALTPTIESLKRDIAELITGLDEKLTSRIEASTGVIPKETAHMITNEIAKLERVIDVKLAELLEVAKATMNHNNSIALAKPGESVTDKDKPEEA